MSKAQEFYTPLQESDLSGYSLRRSRARAPQVAAAAAFWADVMTGKVPQYLLSEAFEPRTPAIVAAINRNYPGIISLSETHTRSDFPGLTGDVLGRMTLARYREFPAEWRKFVRVTANLRDYRNVMRYPVTGLEGPWPEQMEDEELEYGSMAEGTPVTFGPRKYSLGIRLSWELILNDDMDAFNSIPDRLGRGGSRTVNRAVTANYVGVSGPLASVYSAPNGNIITGNPALNMNSLSAAYGQLMGMRDSQGEPIVIDMAVLVVPPALRVTAESLLNATTIRTITAPGATGTEVEYQNWVGSGLSLAVDPYIPVLATTANGNTSWFLFASPASGNAAIEVAFINGYSEPVIFQKIADTARVGGGIDQEAGDFSRMAQEWKGVVAFGSAVIDPRMTVGSNGSGS